MNKFLYLAVTLLVVSCGGGGGNSGSNVVSSQSSSSSSSSSTDNSSTSSSSNNSSTDSSSDSTSDSSQLQLTDARFTSNSSFTCGPIIEKENEFRYCWEENITLLSVGTDYSATILEPLTVTFDGLAETIPEFSYAESLYKDYGIILSDEGGVSWTKEYSYALYEMIKRLGLNFNGETFDYRGDALPYSKWTLTDDLVVDDISITDSVNGTSPGGGKFVNLTTQVFTNAIPRMATVDGKKGRYFSNRLHHAVLRFVTDNGEDSSKVNEILKNRYGVSVSIPDYVALTGEQASRFQAFKGWELIAIMSMFEEMPPGMHKIDGLNYLVRRLDGTFDPTSPTAPAIAYPGAGYIIFMEHAFVGTSLDYLHRLILHEKAHFLWSKIFDDNLLSDWVTLGGWTHSCVDGTNPCDIKDYFNVQEGWTTSKQTEFVSAYAHGKNPNEDMAESISYFIVNPDALKSRAMGKYEFIRDRIMQGTIYISTLSDQFTFKVYNLYPDYVYPGKIKRLEVIVTGAPNEKKSGSVTIELHALDNYLEGAKYAYTRIFSEADTSFDIYLYPVEGYTTTGKDADGNDVNIGTVLRGTFELAANVKKGFWSPRQISVTDQVGNTRNEGVNDFGFRMFVNSLNEDIAPPKYIANSATLAKGTAIKDGLDVQTITATWQVEEELMLGASNQCFGALNDDNAGTYAFQRYGDALSNSDCKVVWFMPDYMPSGNYYLNYIVTRDLAKNRTGTYFRGPAGLDYGRIMNEDSINTDEPAPQVNLTTLNPDTNHPELDINSISISATPTNPSAPNGETVVNISFRVRDDISGYDLGSLYLRDPQGLVTQFYHYPEGGGSLAATADGGAWKDHIASYTLPVGSAPGTWGLIEMTVIDKAENFKYHNFTEIVSFVVDE